MQFKNTLELYVDIIQSCSEKDPRKDTEYSDMLDAVRWFLRNNSGRSLLDVGHQNKGSWLRLLGLYETWDIQYGWNETLSYK